MTFNSFEFLLFYPLVLLFYFALPKKTRPYILLAASYYFYICNHLALIFLILGTTLVSYFSARIIEGRESRGTRRAALVVTLVVCLGALFFFKYFNFLFGSVVGLVSLLGGTPSFVELNIILPVGISFYTFQTLSYVIDVYRGRIAAERSFVYYALFVSFFPQLVAGPIERPENLLPQLKSVSGAGDATGYRWCREDAVKGAKHMMVGFFKKIVVADLVSVYVDSVYNNVGSVGSFGIIIATCLFAVQIYCDFSGYTDIAIGCSRIMGIRLMKNFDHPYMATGIKEFWSRWHISLSSWFKDYLYIPLGGSRCTRWRHLLNLMIVFLVSGLWHGAAWTFVIWGALHGIYQVVGIFTSPIRNRLLLGVGLSPDSALVKWTRRAVTFILVSFAWIFFRAGSISDAIALVGGLGDFSLGIGATLELMGLDLTAALTTALSIATLIMIERLLHYEETPDGSDAIVRNGSFTYFVWIVMLAWALLLSKDMMSTFIYFQF